MPGAVRSLLPLLAALRLSAGHFLKRHSHELEVADEQETCSPLKNHETYSSVSVMVGTPSQPFDLVADTGSNNCIVMDCTCKQCPHEWGKCFTGTGKSKTFDLPKYKANPDPTLGSKAQTQFLPASMLLTFGSGQIAAHVASDEVKVGHTRAFMKNGLLLMVDQALHLMGPFEGILGLGRPPPEEEKPSNKSKGELDITVPGYAEAAGVTRFSMCFNREADGVLGLNTAHNAKQLPSVGQIHWGVDFQGISIGEGSNRHKVKFCDPQSKKPGQETVCGLIPDSGTTMITGPEHQLADLYTDLCTQWPRCQEAYAEVTKEIKDMESKGMEVGGMSLFQQADPAKEVADAFKKLQDIIQAGMQAPDESGSGDAQDVEGIIGGEEGALPQAPSKDMMKANVFLLLLEHCADWAQGVDMDKELPKLNFHVAGSDGTATELQLPAKTYIMTATADVVQPSIKTVKGMPLEVTRRKKGKVCLPAFQPAPFTTKMNGDVWIMGTPLFYEYTAHYDRGTKDGKKPSMAFTHKKEQACGRCQDYHIVRSAAAHSLTQKRSELGVDALRHLTKAPVVRNLTNTESV